MGILRNYCLLFFFLLIGSLSFGQRIRNKTPKFPFVNSNIAKFKNVSRDSNGIPMLVLQNDKVYFPVQYTQIALHYYANYLETHSQEVKKEFLKQAYFIKDAIVNYDEFSVWECDQEIPGYELTIPWSSSMAQGFGIGVMLQAYALTKSKDFLRVAEKAMRAYKYDVKNKGIRSKWGEYDFYEEYADEDSHILNGFIFSLAGLYYYHKVLKDKESKKLFDIGIESLKAKLHEYDANFTSYYGKLNRGNYQYASAINDDPDHYHELVIYQLLTLFSWTGEVVFWEYANKFLSYDTGKVTDFWNHDKFLKISSSHTIDPQNFGTDTLNDELWSWGKYWSTNKFPTELIIDFRKSEKNISQIIFYSISEETLPQDFEVLACDDNEKCSLILSSQNADYTYLRKYETGNYKTLIKGYSIEGNPKGNRIIIKFLEGDYNLVALREINILFDRSDVCSNILKLVRANENLE